MKFILTVEVARSPLPGDPTFERLVLRHDARSVENNSGHEAELGEMIKYVSGVITTNAVVDRDSPISADYVVRIRRVRVEDVIGEEVRAVSRHTGQ